MSICLTSSGLQGDYGRSVYTVYFNGYGITGVNFPRGSIVQFGLESSPSIPLTGAWNGVRIQGLKVEPVNGITYISGSSTVYILQRTG